MFVRRSPAIVLGLVLGAAALAPAPAVASDGGAAKDGTPDPRARVLADPTAKRAADPVKEWNDCGNASKVKLRATLMTNGEIEVVGVVFSDDDDVWSWKFKHNGDFSAMGDVKAKDADRSLRIVRSMIDFVGTDLVFFRAENNKTGEVCRVEATV